jgi:hypothetical protein
MIFFIDIPFGSCSFVPVTQWRLFLGLRRDLPGLHVQGQQPGNRIFGRGTKKLVSMSQQLSHHRPRYQDPNRQLLSLHHKHHVED